MPSSVQFLSSALSIFICVFGFLSQRSSTEFPLPASHVHLPFSRQTSSFWSVPFFFAFAQPHPASGPPSPLSSASFFSGPSPRPGTPQIALKYPFSAIFAPLFRTIFFCDDGGTPGASSSPCPKLGWVSIGHPPNNLAFRFSVLPSPSPLLLFEPSLPPYYSLLLLFGILSNVQKPQFFSTFPLLDFPPSQHGLLIKILPDGTLTR